MTGVPDRILLAAGLARVEGEGGLQVRVKDGHLVDVRLDIYEPPRFFEAFLRGRRFTEPPDITSRICGICPVAYQMSACQAIEAAAGVRVEGPLRDLRRLLYCGEWIESHTLHVYLLHAPDFLGYDGMIDMARDHRAIVERGLQLKKAGNQIMEVVGGRAVHPVNVRVGGFHRVPSRAELRPLVERLLVARDAAVDTVRWVGSFDVADFEVDYDLVALCHPSEYAVLSGRLESSAGAFSVEDFEDHVVEEQVEHSNALHAHLRHGGSYLVGPLARFARSFDKLAPLARQLAREVGIGPECRNPFRSIVIRALEVVHACEEALAILADYDPPGSPAVAVEPGPGTGCAATEAPRGILYHRYRIGADGLIEQARIVPPTSQNLRRIEEDLATFAASRLDLPDVELTRWCEQAVRNYDPCISCATHFLHLERSTL